MGLIIGAGNTKPVFPYDYYMKVNLQYVPKTVMFFMKPMRTIVKRALNKGLLLENPV